MRLLKYLFAVTSVISCLDILAQGSSKIDVIEYDFNIEISDKTDSISGSATIRFVALDNDSTVAFDLAGINTDGKGMRVIRVITTSPFSTTVAFNAGVRSFIHANDRILIHFKRKLERGEICIIEIQYSGVPADGLIISKNKFGHRTFFSDNWPNRAHQWIPCKDDPADKAIVTFTVEAPSHYRVISNGVEMKISNSQSKPGKVTRWRETLPLPTKVMVIGVADFAISLADTVSGIPVTSWVFPENAKEGFNDYAPAVPILSFFIDYIGPYPYKKLANVQTKTMFGGMENASAIFYFENSVNGKQDQQSLIAHEIAHQWFGNMATEKSFAHLWLSEGFATYMAILYAEKSEGADKARDLREEDREQVISFLKRWDRPVVDSVSPYMELLNANSYQKGGWILHMLRRQLGDSMFHQCIRAYYAAYAGKNADTRDLQHVFEKVSGKNLEEFFTQWLYTPGIPKLDIKWQYNAAEQKLNVNVMQLQKTPFKFPLELSIESSVGSKKETIQVSEANQTFSISVGAKPGAVKADPGVNLLFEGKVGEVK